MKSTRRQSGAVNLIFLIITILIALFGWALWYSASKHAKTEAARADAKAKETLAIETAFVRARAAYDALAEKVGNVQKLPDPTPFASNEAWQAHLTERHSVVSKFLTNQDILDSYGAGRSDSLTLMGLFEPIDGQLRKLKNDISSMKRESETLATAKTTAEQANLKVVEQHATALGEKDKELVTVRERGDTQLRASEEKNDKTSKDLKEVTDKLTEAFAKHQKEMQDAADKLISLEREVATIKIPERIKRATEEPDGRVVEVDPKLGFAWIDLGAKNFVRRGTRFKCYDVVKGGVREDHGYIVVLDLTPEKAKCSIEGGAPIKPGDLITNPHFDKKSTKRFFMLGELPGRFDKQTAANKLRALGGSVEEKMSIHVDFLVLGNDPNPEAVGENANPDWFKDRPEYNDAMRFGIEIIRARDLETYLME